MLHHLSATTRRVNIRISPHAVKEFVIHPFTCTCSLAHDPQPSKYSIVMKFEVLGTIKNLRYRLSSLQLPQNVSYFLQLVGCLGFLTLTMEFGIPKCTKHASKALMKRMAGSYSLRDIQRTESGLKRQNIQYIFLSGDRSYLYA